jgi:hypothetical protein
MTLGTETREAYGAQAVPPPPAAYAMPFGDVPFVAENLVLRALVDDAFGLSCRPLE